MKQTKGRKCKGCSVDISKKHPNAKFHNKKCKDDYWNSVNPRGKFEHLADDMYTEGCNAMEEGWDGHKNW